MPNRSLQALLLPLIALFLGALSGYSQYDILIQAAKVTSDLFIKFLQLISMPIVFLAIISSITSMTSLQETKRWSYITVKYTVLTTIIAAFIAFVLFNLVDPVTTTPLATATQSNTGQEASYASALLKLIPDNLFKAFSENN